MGIKQREDGSLNLAVSDTGEEVTGLGGRGEDVRVKKGKGQAWLLGV